MAPSNNKSPPFSVAPLDDLANYRRISDRVRRQPDRFVPITGISRANAAINKISKPSSSTPRANSVSIAFAVSNVDKDAPTSRSLRSAARATAICHPTPVKESPVFQTKSSEHDDKPTTVEESRVASQGSRSRSTVFSTVAQIDITIANTVTSVNSVSVQIAQNLGSRAIELEVAQERSLPAVLNENQLVDPNAPVKMMIPVSVEDMPGLPPPIGKPPVWATNRPELCESLPYYNSWQSSYCGKSGYGHSFLVDGGASEGDWFDEDVIITTAGGSKAPDEDGKVKLTKDQGKVPDFKRNIQTRSPIVMIVGRNNAFLQFKCPHRYCVLDFFQVSHVWWIKVNGMKACRYRFERVSRKERSWWAVAGSSPPPTSDTKPYEQNCASCGHVSLQVYSIGWMCLKPQCQTFWKLDNKEPNDDLVYTAAFIRYRTQWPRTDPPFTLRPPLMRTDLNDPYSSTSEIALRGMVCPHCWRCNQRFKWTAWVCQNEGCNFIFEMPYQKVSSAQVQSRLQPEFIGLPNPADEWEDSLVTLRSLGVPSLSNYRILVYEIPECGTVTHFMANEYVNRAKGGPDDMFSDLQDDVAGLERHKMTMNRVSESRANHFSANFGVPYKYTVATENVSFADAHPTIMRALQRMTWAGEFVGAESPKFNELLAVGYFRKQAMGYHDDGEKDLDATIATLSLGCEASMKLRMKEKHYFGRYGKDIQKLVSSNPAVVPGCLNFEERARLHDERADGRITPDQFKDSYPKDVLKKRTAPDVLDMFLRHGDIVIMDGKRIQEFYEHAVEPKGALRFALTSRYINPEASYITNDADRIKGDFQHRPEYEYSGDEPETSLEGDSMSLA